MASNNANDSNNATSSTTSNPNDGPRSVPNSDRRANASNAPKTGVVQPKPQALPKRQGPNSIIVSTRQKGNPVLQAIKSMPWEYGDIPADYVLGVTTCALFLSLKYHKLHPEYIYQRIKLLQGRYALRIVLVLVDINNHEETLKELSKTSLINNVTLILCWKSEECARYLELFKTYEHAPPTTIRQHQSNKYADRMIDFVTQPRSINKTDAVSLVSQFGSLRTAVNARHEEVAGIAGWGDRKVKAWTGAVREGFRTERGKQRKLGEGRALPLAVSRRETMEETRPMSPPGSAMGPEEEQSGSRLPEPGKASEEENFRDDEDALAAMESARSKQPPSEPAAEVPKKRKPNDDPLSDGVMAALSKLRKGGG